MIPGWIQYYDAVDHSAAGTPSALVPAGHPAGTDGIGSSTANPAGDAPAASSPTVAAPPKIPRQTEIPANSRRPEPTEPMDYRHLPVVVETDRFNGDYGLADNAQRTLKKNQFLVIDSKEAQPKSVHLSLSQIEFSTGPSKDIGTASQFSGAVSLRVTASYSGRELSFSKDISFERSAATEKYLRDVMSRAAACLAAAEYCDGPGRLDRFREE
jgi:hypothetical protein